jgi:peptidyl-prolyl cis-trans isomerase SurA
MKFNAFLPLVGTGCSVLSMISLSMISLSMIPAMRANAQDAQRVAAVVNDDIISMHDFDQRMKFVLLTSGLPDNVETRTRVLPQLLHNLVDEKLELQEADKSKVTVDASDIANNEADMERQAGMPHGQLEPYLRTKGIDPETVRQQIRAQIAWADVVRQELSHDLHIGDEAVKGRLAALKANLGKPEYLAAEIFLAVDGPRNEAQVRALGDRLIEQLSQGAPFQSLALQFSQTGGQGQLGWVSDGVLDDELIHALSQLQPNHITPPIRTNDGYHILLLLQKRRIGEGLASGPTADILTVELTSLPSATPAEREDQLKRLKETLAPAKSCDELEKLSKNVPSSSYNRAEKVAESTLPTELVKVIGSLQPGEITEPFDAGNLRRFFAVCGRYSDSADGLPSFEDMKRRMEHEQLENMARRYIRDIRRNAYVDYRY